MAEQITAFSGISIINIKIPDVIIFLQDGEVAIYTSVLKKKYIFVACHFFSFNSRIAKYKITYLRMISHVDFLTYGSDIGFQYLKPLTLPPNLIGVYVNCGNVLVTSGQSWILITIISVQICIKFLILPPLRGTISYL